MYARGCVCVCTTEMFLIVATCASTFSVICSWNYGLIMYTTYKMCEKLNFKLSTAYELEG